MGKIGPRIKYGPLEELDWVLIQGAAWSADQREFLAKLAMGRLTVDRYSTLWSNTNGRLIELKFP